MPFEAQAEYRAAPHRDPLKILEEQNHERVQDLVPLRMSRMIENPFSYFRGAAGPMAADLDHGPFSGGRVFVCGDAHINNFGVYAAPDGMLVFDVNDFDESTIGPWEWDLKRCVTSVFLAGTERGDDQEEIEHCALECARAYRDSLKIQLDREVQARFFDPTRAGGTPEEEPHSKRASARRRVIVALANTVDAARDRTSVRAADRMTYLTHDGHRRVRNEPPVLVPLEHKDHLFTDPAFTQYQTEMPANIALLMSEYRLTDFARRVVGVGSVGTRCYVGVFTGPDGEPLVLQLKQAVLSTLVQFGKQPIPNNPILVPERAEKTPGYRPVTCQRAIQEVTDPYLGAVEVGGLGFYVRQFRDENEGIDVVSSSLKEFRDYVRSCGAQLGRAHARSKDGAFARGYIGSSDRFPKAVVRWAKVYAAQTNTDFEMLKKACAAGRFPVEATGEGTAAPIAANRDKQKSK